MVKQSHLFFQLEVSTGYLKDVYSLDLTDFTLGAALALSTPAVPLVPDLDTAQFSTDVPAAVRAGSQASLLRSEADPKGTQLFCRGTEPTQGTKLK